LLNEVKANFFDSIFKEVKVVVSNIVISVKNEIEKNNKHS
jgi:hypothetical protein